MDVLTKLRKNTDKLERLREEQADLMAQAREEGLALRKIADAAGTTHQTVQNIIDRRQTQAR